MDSEGKQSPGVTSQSKNTIVEGKKRGKGCHCRTTPGYLFHPSLLFQNWKRRCLSSRVSALHSFFMPDVSGYTTAASGSHILTKVKAGMKRIGRNTQAQNKLVDLVFSTIGTLECKLVFSLPPIPPHPQLHSNEQTKVRSQSSKESRVDS